MFNRCTTIRWSITSSLDQGETIAPKVRDHCNQCEQCEHFLEQNKLLQMNFNRSAELEVDSNRCKLISRAIRSLEGHKPEASWFSWLLQNKLASTGIGLVTACLVALMVINLGSQEPVNQYQLEIVNIQDDLSSLNAFVQSVSEPLKVLASEE